MHLGVMGSMSTWRRSAAGTKQSIRDLTMPYPMCHGDISVGWYSTRKGVESCYL